MNNTFFFNKKKQFFNFNKIVINKNNIVQKTSIIRLKTRFPCFTTCQTSFVVFVYTFRIVSKKENRYKINFFPILPLQKNM